MYLVICHQVTGSIALQNLLVMKLREVEETGGGTSAAIGSIEVAAMSQHDLITWYFDYQTSRYVSRYFLSKAAPEAVFTLEHNVFSHCHCLK